MHSHTLRRLALSVITLAACASSVAAEPLLAKAKVPATPVAEVEKKTAAQANFEAVLTAALGTPTAAGSVTPASRAAVEQMAVRLMPAMVP